MKRILVTGANGFLGQHLATFLQQKQFDVIATGRGRARLGSTIQFVSAELTNAMEVARLMAMIQPDVVVHTAALSKPDACEQDRQNCIDINVTATQNLLQSFEGYFIYVSTDFIFGEDGPHSEAAIPRPLNFYGESKLMAENAVRASGVRNAIMRPAFIYGPIWPGLRPTFLHWVKNSLEAGTSIKVVSDQLRTPTFVMDLCRGLEKMIDMEVSGDFHLAGRDIISPYEMAITTANVLGLDATLIENVTSETFPEPVKRSKKSGLTIGKAQAILDYAPITFHEGIRQTFL